MAKEEKRVTFKWEGTNRRGQTVKGTLSGQNAAVVKAMLRKQGVTPKKVRKEAQPFLGLGGGGNTKIGTADITFFTRQMATMIKSGVPLVQAFDIVSDGVDNAGMKKLIGEIRDTVASGNSFASALKQHPNYFRSEERRVGKECRSRWWPYHQKKKKVYHMKHEH